MIFDTERVRLIFRMVEDVDPTKEKRAAVVERLGFNQHVGSSLIGTRDDLERRDFQNVLSSWALPA
jgi:hypothetical protein